MKIFKKIDAYLIKRVDFSREEQITNKEKQLLQRLARIHVNSTYIIFSILFFNILLKSEFHIQINFAKLPVIFYFLYSAIFIWKMWKIDRRIKNRPIKAKSDSSIKIDKNELMFTKEALEKKLNHNKEINS